MFKVTWQGAPVKALLTTWGVVTSPGGKKYLLGKDPTGYKYLSTEISGIEKCPDTGLGVARTKSGSIYAVMPTGRDQDYAETRYPEMRARQKAASNDAPSLVNMVRAKLYNKCS